jgi:hypothetical protein
VQGGSGSNFFSDKGIFMAKLMRLTAYVLFAGSLFIVACGVASFFADESSFVYVFSEKFRGMGLTMLFAGQVLILLDKNKKLTEQLRGRK